MPITTVTKMTGPVTVLMSWMNASASHLALMAASGATRPKAMPAAIAISTQNQSWATRRRRGRVPSGASAAVADMRGSSRSSAGRPRSGGAFRFLRTRDGRRLRLIPAEPPPRHRDRVGARVDEHEPPPERARRRAERPRAGEAVQAPAAGARRGGHHPLHDPDRLLRGVAGPLRAARRHDRVPPRVRRALATGALLGRDEPGRHVRLAVDLGVVEVVALGVLDVDEDRVVLGRPAPPRPAPVVVGPDDLVEEALAAEEAVERDLDVVRFARVEVDVERAVGGERAPDLRQARHEEAEVVVVRVAELHRAERLAAVTPAGEAGALALGVGHHAQAFAALRSARVERRGEGRRMFESSPV